MINKYWFLTMAAFLTALAGCASNPELEHIEIPDFRSVAIVETEEIPSIERLLEGGENVLVSIATGAAMGGGAGLATGVYLCSASGPYIGACYAAVGVGGALAGAATGLVRGIMNLDEGENAQSINRHLTRVADEGNLQNELLTRLQAQVPAEYVLPSRDADILVSPVLSRVNVELAGENSMYLHMVASLIFSWAERDEEGFVGSADFEYRSHVATLEEWNSDDGQLYADTLMEGLDDVALQMGNRILFRLQSGAQTLELVP